jgi:hypothetical protein
MPQARPDLGRQLRVALAYLLRAEMRVEDRLEQLSEALRERAG